MMGNHQKQQNYMTRFTVFSFNYKVKEAFICFLLMNEGYFLPIFCLYRILPVSWELSNDFSNKTIIFGFITLEIMPSLLSSLVSLSRLIIMKNSDVEVTEIGNFSSHCDPSDVFKNFCFRKLKLHAISRHGDVSIAQK